MERFGGDPKNTEERIVGVMASNKENSNTKRRGVSMRYATKYTITVDVYVDSDCEDSGREIARAMADGKINHLVAGILQREDMDAVITGRGNAYEVRTYETKEKES